MMRTCGLFAYRDLWPWLNDPFTGPPQAPEPVQQALARANREAQRPTRRGFKIAQAGLTQQISTIEAKIGKLNARLRTEDEGRALIREMLLTSADIVPQPADYRLLVRLHALANPRRNEALARLCDTLNVLKVCYPGTDLTLVYQAPVVA